MADNTQINIPISNGDLIASEDIGGVKYQKMKLIDPDPTKTGPFGVPANPISNKRVSQGADFAYLVLGDGLAHEVLLAGASLPCMIWVDPVAGDTITVQYKASANAPVQPWAHGPVNVYADIELSAPIYSMIFTRTSGAGTTSKVGVSK